MRVRHGSHRGAVKTCYLYSMASKLINVRLDPERVRKARALRAHGMPLSDVVREAIDDRYRSLEHSRDARNVRAIVRRAFAEHPDPAGLPGRRYDVHDARGARRAIAKRLKRR